MDYVLGFLIGTAVSWVSLLIIVPIAQRLAEFSMPPWPEALWKLAVIAAVANAISIALGPVHVWLSWIVGFVAFWWLMVKWFDVDLFGAVIIVVVSWFLRIFLVGAIVGALLAAT